MAREIAGSLGGTGASRCAQGSAAGGVALTIKYTVYKARARFRQLF